jgi:hypothetical protein
MVEMGEHVRLVGLFQMALAVFAINYTLAKMDGSGREVYLMV